MANLKNFIFNSDYSTDKIAFAKKEIYTITGPADPWRPQVVYINTHIKTQLYPEGDYKSEGSNARYPLAQNYGDIPLGCMAFMYNGECWIAITIWVLSDSFIGKKFEYRLWAYYGENEAKNTDMSPTANINQSRLVLDTDNNYPRFISDGEITLGQSYTHSLGYKPYIKTWKKNADYEMPKPDGSAGTFTTDAYSTTTPTAFFGNVQTASPTLVMIWKSQVKKVTDTQIITYTDGGSDDPTAIYYRIYAL